MSYKTFLRNGAIIFAASLLTLSACKKNDSNSSTSTLSDDDNGGYASDQAKMETNNSDVISIADAAVTSAGASNLRETSTTISSCATISDSVSAGDSFLIINFGPTDCTCRDYKNRRGEIIVQYNGRYKDSASERTITFNNYFVNDNQVTGHKTVQNMGRNSSGQVYYNVQVYDTLILSGGGGTVTWAGNRTRTWLTGYSTATWTDDSYLIGGTTTLTRANGHIFTFAIDTAAQLQVAVTCPYIEAGIVTISSSTFTAGSRTLNYGSGACDDEAQLTIGSHTYNITLH